LPTTTTTLAAVVVPDWIYGAACRFTTTQVS